MQDHLAVIRAAGSADRVTNVKNINAGTNYATLSYTAPGGIATMSMGNGVAQTVAWNDRAQPTNLQVTGPSNPPGNPLLNLGFFPCPSQAASCATGNNGNLQSQTIAAPGLSPSLTQTYSYDTLNRLTAATESGSSGWTQNYGYDVNGNRWVTTNTNLTPLNNETPQSANWYSSTIPNRIASWTYDNAGNVISIPMGANTYRTFTYDAEDRQVSATINGNASNYTYDGLGLRVTKTSGGQTTVYVYDVFGNLAAEYSSQTPTSPCGTPTCYLAVDHLGSTRLLTDANGSSTVARYDYLPFGGELLAGINGRTSGLGYFSVADSTNPKFTGQVRDPETFLDWYQVRFMSGAQGRFQSVDPGNAGADPSNPQTWNGYSYVGNNPLSYTDPSGKYIATAEGATIGSAVGGPFGAAAGAIIGSIIDLGALFAGLFGFGGGGPAIPTWPGEAWEVGGGPWSEQIPYNLGGGSLNTGGVYGSGNTGPFINNIIRNDPNSPDALAAKDIVSTILGLAWDLAQIRQKNSIAVVVFGARPMTNFTPRRLFGTYYCGSGGAGPRGGTVNGACAAHDDCYAGAGIDAGGNTNPGIVWTSGQTAAAGACNQALYDAVKNSSDAGAQGIRLWLRYGEGWGILRRGTSATP